MRALGRSCMEERIIEDPNPKDNGLAVVASCREVQSIATQLVAVASLSLAAAAAAAVYYAACLRACMAPIDAATLPYDAYGSLLERTTVTRGQMAYAGAAMATGRGEAWHFWRGINGGRPPGSIAGS